MTVTLTDLSEAHRVEEAKLEREVRAWLNEKSYETPYRDMDIDMVHDLICRNRDNILRMLDI